MANQPLRKYVKAVSKRARARAVAMFSHVQVLRFLETDNHFESLRENMTRGAFGAGLRHEVKREVDGGYSRVLRDCLTHMLYSPTGFEKGGVMIPVLGRQRVLHALLQALLADGEGLQDTFQFKGASGLRPCLRHANVVQCCIEKSSPKKSPKKITKKIRQKSSPQEFTKRIHQKNSPKKSPNKFTKRFLIFFGRIVLETFR